MTGGYYKLYFGYGSPEIKVRKVMGVWQYFVKFEGISEYWSDMVGDDCEWNDVVEKYGEKIEDWR